MHTTYVGSLQLCWHFRKLQVGPPLFTRRRRAELMDGGLYLSFLEAYLVHLFEDA